jgi:Na+/H+ antiporter NhaA
VQVGPLILEMSISEWIKEGLMAIFFLVVGLEIKYEILRGELSDPRKLATPVLAAAGGMIAPAAVYLAVQSPTLGGTRTAAGRSPWPPTSPSPSPSSPWWRAICRPRCGSSC